ncbi:DUF2141 domain-containing protein [Undibacterium cyanobacteriorum]|uniref:DUF2141 domain-containing protein n=1 Tax=Undibacterium cyanobacteriorum TaxID=3073561 RepID=A0ABY9RG86_9BURK|nr:DUF2141 domain-containing protein [Undibacterium sp. 20NA77.5]WMW80242.1 DUF2141 domain-containing protein [Undibacterium sp. 20NA77.5]
MKSASLFLSTLLLASAFGTAHAAPAELKVEVHGIKQSKGEIMVALFDKKEKWLRDAIARKSVDARLGAVEVVFTDLPEGEYAISVLHDANSNGAMDTNAIGIPTEAYGFSNDASGSFGPASYADAKFKVEGANKSISIRVN